MITTNVTSANTKNPPVAFSIVFNKNVIGLTTSDLEIVNGTVLSLVGSGSNWTALVNPSEHGDIVSLKVKANAVTNDVNPPTESNLESNTSSVQFDGIRPIPVINMQGVGVTNSHFIDITIVFNKDVIGFTESGLLLSNASVTSFSGSGSIYLVTLSLINDGYVLISVKENAATDSCGNLSVETEAIKFMFDSAPFANKSNILNEAFKKSGSNNNTDVDTFFGGDSKTVIKDFTYDELLKIPIVAEATKIADCAKDIPQKLLNLAKKKAFDLLLANPNVKQLTSTLLLIKANVDTITTLIDKVQESVKHPETLMQELLTAQGLTGEALSAKIADITTKFGSVTGLNDIMARISSLDICGELDYNADGTSASPLILTPTSAPPPPVSGVQSAVTNTYDPLPKNMYDQFLFSLREHLEINTSEPQSADRAQMMAKVHTLAMGYHDGIAQTTDSSRDSELFEKYTKNVAYELQTSPNWASDIKQSFSEKAEAIGNLIQRNSQVIRDFKNKDKPISGKVISTGVTVYSGPADDYTTYLDIKPSQRPPELTQMYISKGYKIPTGKYYTNSNGNTFEIGTLNYSDAFNGAYGKIESDKTVASARFPGGSIIALRSPDGTAYDPTGNNPSGHFTVKDTGNSELTYKKPDIFTMTPRLYTKMDSVQVILIKEGTGKGPKYQKALAAYGRGY